MDECHRLDKFMCNVSRQCIPKVLVCNGYQECTENEDESPPTCTKEVCRRNERFFCDVSRMCIDEVFVCTGYKDCTSGEDEYPPACTMDLCHENNLFFCNVSRQCIHKGFVCNGYPDCHHHDDEDSLACDASSFKTMATESTDKDHSLKTPLIVISAIFTVVVVAVGIICYIWARKRFNRHQIEHMEPRRVFPVHVPQGRQPSRSRRRQSSHVYSDIDEETMENYHYICEQNPPDHYDKVNDRPPCICSHCVRERVQPMLNRAPSCFSVVKPYATGGGDIRRTSSIHSYISNRELNTRRSITEYGSESGIVSTKEITDDSNSRRSITNSGGKDELDSAGKTKPRLGVTHSDSDLERVDKTNKTKGDTPRRCVAKSKSSIELVSTNDYLDVEALYQAAKEEDRRKLAAKYFDEGEEVFGNFNRILLMLLRGKTVNCLVMN